MTGCYFQHCNKIIQSQTPDYALWPLNPNFKVCSLSHIHIWHQFIHRLLIYLYFVESLSFYFIDRDKILTWIFVLSYLDKMANHLFVGKTVRDFYTHDLQHVALNLFQCL